MVTCRFGVRRSPNGGPESCFEVFDRMTGAAVASGMGRVEAEADARRRNQDTSGSAVCSDLLEFAALRTAIDGYLARAGRHARILVARAAQALDELRAELAQADRLVADQQARIGELYELLPGDGRSG
jgi:hypothetical protein